MIFREATPSDFIQLHEVRMAVRENTLSNPNLITEKDYTEFITVRGKSWLCEIENKVVGFSIVDLKENNIWALFVHPDFEGKGIGKKLHKLMLDWYFEQTKEKVWLGTSPNTRAELFYEKQGWTAVGKKSNGEMGFEMTWEDWRAVIC